MAFFGLYFGASMFITIAEDARSALVGIVVGVFGTVIIAFCLCRLAWVGVRVHDGGTDVRNPLRTYRLPWWAIKGFRWGRKGLLPKGLAGLHDGRTIPLWGIPVTVLWPERSWGGKVVIALNAHLAAIRDDRPCMTFPPWRGRGGISSRNAGGDWHPMT